MFGRKQAKIDGLKMAFYTDAAADGSHGKILVTSRRRGLEREVVNFVFVGMTAPPALTPALMEHIWTEAKAQGFVPFEIVGALEVNAAPSKENAQTVILAGAPLPAVLAPAATSEALNLQELGRTPVQYSDPSHPLDPARFERTEVPAFLRKEAGQLATA
jgi:hypothetical protein